MLIFDRIDWIARQLHVVRKICIYFGQALDATKLKVNIFLDPPGHGAATTSSVCALSGLLYVIRSGAVRFSSTDRGHRHSNVLSVDQFWIQMYEPLADSIAERIVESIAEPIAELNAEVAKKPNLENIDANCIDAKSIDAKNIDATKPANTPEMTNLAIAAGSWECLPDLAWGRIYSAFPARPLAILSWQPPPGVDSN